MKIFSTLSSCPQEPCVIALGCFDGVHLGHAQVIREARAIADKKGLPLTVWTFRSPPKNYFFPNTVPVLTLPEEKEAQLKLLGADTVLHIPFDQSMAEQTPEAFVLDILQAQLAVEHIVCGFNFTFGAKGAGNTQLLRTLCEKVSIGLTVLPPFQFADQTISSSLIRQALSEGNMEDAAAYLGRPYSISAPVVRGQGLAHQLGFPTANQLFPKEKAIPAFGAYAVEAIYQNKTYGGIANVGMRPTVNGTLLCLETNLFDFSDDLYDQELTVCFRKHLRPEIRFSSLDRLSQQVFADIQKAKALLEALHDQ